MKKEKKYKYDIKVMRMIYDNVYDNIYIMTIMRQA